MEIIFVIGAVQAFFWAFLLVSKKSHTLADTILGSWMLIIGLNILSVYLQYTEFDYNRWPRLLGFSTSLPLLYGPLLLLYIQTQAGKFNKLKSSHFLHLLPFIIGQSLLAPQYLMPTPELIIWVDGVVTSEQQPITLLINETMVVLSGVIYIFWSWIELNKLQKKAEIHFSEVSSVNLSWLRKLILFMADIWLVVIFSEFMYYFFQASFLEFFSANSLIFFTVVIFTFAVGFFGIKQGEIFTPLNTESEAKPNPTKYSRSGLDDSRSSEILDKLSQYMENEKPFLEQGLTLVDIVNQTGIPKNHISQVINEQLGQNFFEWVNRYRVDEFKLRVLEDATRTKTLLGHALDSGFSSKSTFNNTFKKTEGITPSAYLASLEQG